MDNFNFKVPRIISEGLAGWLMYEHHSYRADLFSEKYLAHGIGNLLNGNPFRKTIAEYDHPVLRPHKTWAGRNPQIDFVQLDKDGKPEIAIESKFVGIGASKLNAGDVIWDLIRLELVSYHLGIKCYFVVAGKKKKIDEFFTGKLFFDRGRKEGSGQLLPIPGKPITKLNVLACSDKRLSSFKKYLLQYKDVPMPTVIRIVSTHFYPKVCSNFDNQVFVWEISSLNKKPRFIPAQDPRIAKAVQRPV